MLNISMTVGEANALLMKAEERDVTAGMMATRALRAIAQAVERTAKELEFPNAIHSPEDLRRWRKIRQDPQRTMDLWNLVGQQAFRAMARQAAECEASIGAFVAELCGDASRGPDLAVR